MPKIIVFGDTSISPLYISVDGCREMMIRGKRPRYIDVSAGAHSITATTVTRFQRMLSSPRRSFLDSLNSDAGVSGWFSNLLTDETNTSLAGVIYIDNDEALLFQVKQGLLKTYVHNKVVDVSEVGRYVDMGAALAYGEKTRGGKKKLVFLALLAALIIGVAANTGKSSGPSEIRQNWNVETSVHSPSPSSSAAHNDKSDAAGGTFALPSPSVPADNPPAAPSDEAPAGPLEGFIFPDSDKELLGQEEIAGLSDSDLLYAINEIYARHGYIFRAKDLLEYYEQFDWYTPEVPADSFSSVKSFNQIEKQNWTMLVNERNTRPAIFAPESEDWVYAALASSGDKSVEALVLRELAEDGKWSKYFDGKASDVWLKEYPTKSSRVRQQATVKTGREFELFITNNANAYRSRMGTVDENMTAYDMAAEEYYLSKFEKMHSELDWLGANPVLDSSVELINGNSWNVYSGYNSGKGTQDRIWFFFFMDETQEIMAEVSYEYVLYSGASPADEELFNEWYLNLSESLLIR